MELRHLKAFLAVAEELHFGRAAKRLQMAQPPLSQQIRQLEKELGVQLFRRNTRSVRLTGAGETFLDPVRTVLDDLDTAVRAARSAGRGEYGRVTIGFAGASSHETLPRLTRAVRAAHPGLELVMTGQTYANVALSRVADGSLDLGFVRLPVTRPGVEHRVIDEEELLCALPFDHPLARYEAVPLGELADEPFVSFPANSGSTVRDAMTEACESAGFTPRVVQEAPDSYTIMALVAAACRHHPHGHLRAAHPAERPGLPAPHRTAHPPPGGPGLACRQPLRRPARRARRRPGSPADPCTRTGRRTH